MDKIINIVLKLIISIGFAIIASTCESYIAYGLGGFAMFLIGTIDCMTDKDK
jgi:hypothetical protein